MFHNPCWLFDDLPQAECSRDQYHADNREAERELVTDHLCGGAQTAEQRKLAVRRPAGESDAVHTKRGDRQDEEHADVEVGNLKTNLVPANRNRFAKWNHCDRGKGHRERDEWSKVVDKTVDLARLDVFFEEELEPVGEGLEKSVGAHEVRPPARLNPGNNFPLEPDRVGDAREPTRGVRPLPWQGWRVRESIDQNSWP